MATTYRKRRGGHDEWHFCTNCQNWPTYNYDERHEKPTDDELCNECKSKKRDGTCKES